MNQQINLLPWLNTVNRGWIEVSDRPGLGVTLNENVVRQHLAPGTGYFEPTPQWDNERSWDRLWS